MLPHSLHIMLAQAMQTIGEQFTSANISIGLLVMIECQVTNLQVKVHYLMKGKGRK